VASARAPGDGRATARDGAVSSPFTSVIEAIAAPSRPRALAAGLLIERVASLLRVLVVSRQPASLDGVMAHPS
jgi:hypothetical protein